MDIKEEEEIKKEFQLERVVLFSDAVFAIIITIMVLEIKLPEGIRDATSEERHHAFIELIPKLVAYLTAFFIVGLFWSKHLKIFSYLKDYSMRLIVLNLVFLFCISLFPFGVSVLTATIAPGKFYGLFIYLGLIMTAMLTQTILTAYLIHNAKTLCIRPDEIEKNLEWKATRLNFISIPLLFCYVILGSFLGFRVEFYSYGFVAWALFNAAMRRKYNPNPQADAPMIVRLFKSIKKESKKTTTVAPKPITEPQSQDQ